jgi:hypothetical protein
MGGVAGCVRGINGAQSSAANAIFGPSRKIKKVGPLMKGNGGGVYMPNANVIRERYLGIFFIYLFGLGRRGGLVGVSGW